MYKNKYNLTSQEIPSSIGWTGAEIESCSRMAAEFDMSLVEASQYIVPIAKSAPEIVDSLRQQASGKFLNASNSGVYEYYPLETISSPRSRGTFQKLKRKVGDE